MWTLFKLLWQHPELLPLIFIKGRYRVCSGCNHFRRGWIRRYCGICKCTLCNKRSRFCKTSYYDQECPDGRWGKLEKRQ